MLKHTHLAALSFLLITGMAGDAPAEKIPFAKSKIIPPTPEWTAKIQELAPAKPRVDAAKRKVLVFSLFTGFKHDVIPHVDRVFEVLGRKSGAFDTTRTVDIEALTPLALAAYDVLVLNNNCSIHPRRNLFLDELERNPKYRGMTEKERQTKANALEQSILDFVAGGKGLVAIHGAPTMLNNSAKFTEMVGGAFDYHPSNQELALRTVNVDHPLVAAFRGKEPFIHRDEPYFFKGPYEKLNFHPLLSLDVKGIKGPQGQVGKIVRYVAWIKPYDKGRVFYCSPSHFPESYETSTLLQFLLDGVQYASGDLKCDDSKTTAKNTFIDYFRPMPIVGGLLKDVWGAAEVGARDPKNGLEDPQLARWNYWDGPIVKGPDGKFHMFASRWEQRLGHEAWWESKIVHAVSDSMMGPYVDKGLCWPDDEGGKGHNVTALVLPDGRYALVISEIRPGTVFVSKSLGGPWKRLGTIQGKGLDHSNISVMVRPDGDFMIVPRSGRVFISKAADGVLGPYVTDGRSAFPRGIPNLEDPAIFYSGGLYHIIVNSWNTRKAYHLTSKDGKSGWVNRGLAYDPTTDFCRYTDGTVNHWHKMERPGVTMENGHVVAVTLAVLDTPKESQTGNNGHGSKILVIPFDGRGLDGDIEDGNAADRAGKVDP